MYQTVPLPRSTKCDAAQKAIRLRLLTKVEKDKAKSSEQGPHKADIEGRKALPSMHMGRSISALLKWIMRSPPRMLTASSLLSWYALPEGRALHCCGNMDCPHFLPFSSILAKFPEFHGECCKTLNPEVKDLNPRYYLLTPSHRWPCSEIRKGMVSLCETSKAEMTISHCSSLLCFSSCNIKLNVLMEHGKCNQCQQIRANPIGLQDD